MNCRIEPYGEGKQVIINGDMTIEHADELKKVLRENLPGESGLLVDLKNVSAVDLSALQLLCSAHRTAVAANKFFTLGNSDSEVFARAVKDAGFGRKTGCHLDAQASCIWKGETR